MSTRHRQRACRLATVTLLLGGLGACGLDALGTATTEEAAPTSDRAPSDGAPNENDATSSDASQEDARDATAVVDGSGDASADGSSDAGNDADASCKPNGSTCGSPSQCCSLSCEDQNGTLRCQ